MKIVKSNPFLYTSRYSPVAIRMVRSRFDMCKSLCYCEKKEVVVACIINNNTGM